jgi:hypothetical protein
MSLADILSLDGTLPNMMQDRILLLRLVSREIMIALETNISLQINLRIYDSGDKNLSAEFLKKWHGGVHLHCSCLWNPEGRWFKEVADALLLGQLRPLNLLSLSVEGRYLIPLVETLSEIGPAIQQLEITYRGNRADLLAAAAPLAALGHTLTTNIYIEGKDPAGLMMTWLLASSINISSISFRSSSPFSNFSDFGFFRSSSRHTFPQMPTCAAVEAQDSPSRGLSDSLNLGLLGN